MSKTPRVDAICAVAEAEKWSEADLLAEIEPMARDFEALLTQQSVALASAAERIAAAEDEAQETTRRYLASHAANELLVGNLKAAEARAERAKKDAGRYRWLRSDESDWHEYGLITDNAHQIDKYLDETIDAALAETERSETGGKP